MEALPLPCCKTPLVHGIGPLPRYPLAPSMTVIRLRSESYRFELPPHSLSHMHSSSRPLGCSGIGCTFFSPRDCHTFSPRDCQTLFSSRFGVRCGPVARPCARVWFGAMCLLRVRLRRARARRSLLGGSGRSPGLCVRAGARACVIGRIMRPKAPFGAKEFRFKLGYPCSPRSRGSTRAWRTHLGVRSHFSRGKKAVAQAILNPVRIASPAPTEIVPRLPPTISVHVSPAPTENVASSPAPKSNDTSDHESDSYLPPSLCDHTALGLT